MLNTNLREILHYQEACPEEFEELPWLDLLPDEDYELYRSLLSKAGRLENLRLKEETEQWFLLAETNGIISISGSDINEYTTSAIEIIGGDLIATKTFPTYRNTPRLYFSCVTGKQVNTPEWGTVLVISESARSDLLKTADGDFRKSIEEAEVL